MTKQQLKDNYLEWNRSIGALQKRHDDIFKKLQQLNVEHGTGKAWCSISENMKDLILSNYDVNKIYPLIAEYNQIAGKFDALKDLALKTNNFKINN